MVVEIRFRIRHRGCYSERITAGGRVLHVGGDGSHCLAVMHAEDEVRLAALADACGDLVDEHGVLDRTRTTLVYRCRCLTLAEGGVADTVRAHAGTIIWPIVYAEGLEHFTVLLPGRDRLPALADALRALGDLHLDRVGDVDARDIESALPVGAVLSRFTPRQLAALSLAIDRGYYASPKRTSADELAVAFGVSRSTYLEHLRKAEAILMAGFAGVLASHPAVRDAASSPTSREPPAPAARAVQGPMTSSK